ncbi:MAG: 4Fe-4S cluster-binding domain-containing protein [Pedobacter sp.]|nr:MAG: 4Fe-4S cluster-binding domain-containing protein [Pedobacter sp.]
MEHFYTLQGEGYHQGRAAYFIRLGGCDVGCVWCDVKDSWDASKHPQFSLSQIVEMVETGCAENQQRPEDVLVVITGGEPLMHQLDGLTSILQSKGFQTNIETSGSSPFSGSWDWVCLSPKKFKAPRPDITPFANELKVIVFNKSDFKWAEEYAKTVSDTCKLYLQPEWSKSKEMTPLIIDYVMANPKWEISLQTHKFLNIP